MRTCRRRPVGRRPGTFTTSHSSYSAQALAANGITPGATVSHGGLSFPWPEAPAGTKDNVEADGQLITLSGSGGHLGFLGAATYGTQGGTGTVFYTDGSSSQFSLSFADWYTPTKAADVVATMPYLNNATQGRVNQTVGLYFASVPIDMNKTVAALRLPETGPPSGPGLHVFAMAVGA